MPAVLPVLPNSTPGQPLAYFLSLYIYPSFKFAHIFYFFLEFRFLAFALYYYHFWSLVTAIFSLICWEMIGFWDRK
jgi:hypothetical protein